MLCASRLAKSVTVSLLSMMQKFAGRAAESSMSIPEMGLRFDSSTCVVDAVDEMDGSDSSGPPCDGVWSAAADEAREQRGERLTLRTTQRGRAPLSGANTTRARARAPAMHKDEPEGARSIAAEGKMYVTYGALTRSRVKVRMRMRMKMRGRYGGDRYEAADVSERVTLEEKEERTKTAQDTGIPRGGRDPWIRRC